MSFLQHQTTWKKWKMHRFGVALRSSKRKTSWKVSKDGVSRKQTRSRLKTNSMISLMPLQECDNYSLSLLLNLIELSTRKFNVEREGFIRIEHIYQRISLSGEVKLAYRIWVARFYLNQTNKHLFSKQPKVFSMKYSTRVIGLEILYRVSYGIKITSSTSKIVILETWAASRFLWKTSLLALKTTWGIFLYQDREYNH